MLNRNLFYTAVTRGKGRVILVGSKWAVGEAIRRVDTLKRHTLLAKRIVTALEKMEGAYGAELRESA
jgi:exodeoxyribonuclease V alpha subunit